MGKLLTSHGDFERALLFGQIDGGKITRSNLKKFLDEQKVIARFAQEKLAVCSAMSSMFLEIASACQQDSSSCVNM